MTVRVGVLLAVLAATAGAGCGADEPAPPDAAPAAESTAAASAGGAPTAAEAPVEGPAGAWSEAPAPPLAPRQWAVGAWTGAEVVVVGGSTAPACPPNADCAMPREPLADGAAFDPAARTWRAIPDAPVAFDWGQAVAVGGTVYVWVPPSPVPPDPAAAFLAYDALADRWSELPLPAAADPSALALAAAGEHLVAYSTTDERGEQPDWLFRPGAGTWEELPADPLGPSFDRALTAVGSRVVLTAKDLVPNPGADGPALVRAAAFDVATTTWSELPPSDTLGNGPWFGLGDRLVNPALGSEDGGEVGNWGRDVPNGAILDLAAEPAWSPLPPGPQSELELAAGVLADGTAGYVAPGGWVLDLDAAAWRRLTAPEAIARNATIVTAGRLLVAFGGAADGPVDDAAPTLTNATAVWDPDAPAP